MVHDKILNFLTPVHNLAALEGREAMVKNLFGSKKVVVEELVAGKKRRRDKEEVKDDIALIWLIQSQIKEKPKGSFN